MSVCGVVPAVQLDLTGRWGPRRDALHGPPGQGARLVRGEQGDRAQGLDGRQRPDDGAASRHPAGTAGQSEADDRGQRLGDGRHGQADPGEDHDLPVLAAQQPEHDDHEAGDHRQDGQLLPEPPQPALQRSHRRLTCGQQPGEDADLAPHARADDGRLTATPHDRGAGVQHGHAIGDGDLVLQDAPGILRGRHRLPRERGLVDLQPLGLQQPGVRGDQVPFPHQEDVSRHQLDRRYGPDLAATPDPRRRRRQGAQRGDVADRPPLLDHPDGRVDRDDQPDDGGVRHVTGEQGQHERGQQDEDHRLPQLVEHRPPQRLGPLERNVVPAHVRQPPGRLPLGQPLAPAHAEHAEHLVAAPGPGRIGCRAAPVAELRVALVADPRRPSGRHGRCGARPCLSPPPVIPSTLGPTGPSRQGRRSRRGSALERARHARRDGRSGPDLAVRRPVRDPWR